MIGGRAVTTHRLRSRDGALVESLDRGNAAMLSSLQSGSGYCRGTGRTLGRDNGLDPVRVHPLAVG